MNVMTSVAMFCNVLNSHECSLDAEFHTEKTKKKLKAPQARRMLSNINKFMD